MVNFSKLNATDAESGRKSSQRGYGVGVVLAAALASACVAGISVSSSLAYGLDQRQTTSGSESRRDVTGEEFDGSIDGISIIEKLDVKSLAEKTSYRFYLKGTHARDGNSYLVPVMVTRGSDEGPTLMLNSATHGDELNGVRVVQEVMGALDADTLNGTVVGIPGLNQNAMELDNRNFRVADEGGYLVNANRNFPGKEHGNQVEEWCYNIWENLVIPNADALIDLHTYSRGGVNNLFTYSDLRNQSVADMATRMNADTVLNDPGASGTLETELVKRGIPSLTYELGMGKVWDLELIERATQGVRNYMSFRGMIAVPEKVTEPIIANKGVSVNTKVGGPVEYKVELNQEVKQGDTLGIQYNRFGDVIAEYVAPHDGRILSVGVDPLAESAKLVARVYWDTNEGGDTIPTYIPRDSKETSDKFLCGAYDCGSTEYEGFYEGAPVVSQLDVSTLPAGSHRFWVPAGTTGLSRKLLLPVMVTRGEVDPDSTHLFVNTGVHGDELNGMRVVQELFNLKNINSSSITGTLIGVPGLNENGMERDSKYFHYRAGYETADSNKLFGETDETKVLNGAKQWAFDAWNNLIVPNLVEGRDYMVDLHTQTRGTTYPLVVFSDYRNAAAKLMAESIFAEVIKQDAGGDGSVETECLKRDVGAVTFEMGNPKIWDRTQIDRAYNGILNLMNAIGMREAAPERTYEQAFFSNDVHTIAAKYNAWTIVSVKIGDDLQADDEVAVQMNAFGDVLQRYTAGVAGKVLAVSDDPIKASGATLVQMSYVNDAAECQEAGCREGSM